MLRILTISAMLMMAQTAWAGEPMTQAEAFNAGKEYANTGKGVAGSKINSTTGSAALPYYGTTAPETANFQDGRNLIGGAGTNKQVQCETYIAPNAFQQQECDAVNFMTKNPTQRAKFTIDKVTDPIMVGSKDVINNPGSVTGAPTQTCRVQKTKVPTTYLTETCVETFWLEPKQCSRKLVAGEVSCANPTNGGTPLNLPERTILTINGNIDHELRIKVRVATPTGNAWSGGGYSGELYSGVDSIGGYYQEIYESYHGDLPANIAYTPYSLGEISDIQLVSGLAQFRVIGGNVPSVGVSEQPSRYNNWTATVSFYTPAAGEQWINGYLVMVPNICVIEAWESTCDQYQTSLTCGLTNETCVDGPSTKVISGVTLTRQCWEYQNSYQCRSQDMINDCQPLRDKGCSQVNAACADRDDQGTCVMYEQTYNCPDKPETFTEKTVCDQSAFCQDGGAGCFDTSATPDKDFGQTAAMMEAAREAGVYGVDPSKVEIFKGYMSECSLKVLGGSTLKNCCSSAGGGSAFSNYALLGAGMSVASAAGRESVAMGSKYVYDSLYNKVDSTIVNKGLDAMNSWASNLADGTVQPQFGFYGFTFEFSFANGFQFVGFDPTTFAISVGIMLVQEWLSCDQDEQVTAMKRGQNLCVHIETYCSKRFLKICIEKKERHCCFNSMLAKLINRQGRAQLGMAMNSCGGFNQDQLLALDFSSMDLSEFIASVVPKDANLPQMTENVKNSVNQRVQNYYKP